MLRIAANAVGPIEANKRPEFVVAKKKARRLLLKNSRKNFTGKPLNQSFPEISKLADFCEEGLITNCILYANRIE